MAIQVVSFHCVLKDKRGRILGSTFNNGVFTHDAKGPQALKALVEAMQDLKPGEKRSIELRADQAYGFYDPSLVITRSTEDVFMSAPVKVGESIVYETDGKKKTYHVTEITSVSVTLDANHPLAGQDLTFEIEAVTARDATVKELDELNSDSTTSGFH